MSEHADGKKKCLSREPSPFAVSTLHIIHIYQCNTFHIYVRGREGERECV